MELKKLLSPWNWFKKEGESRSSEGKVLSKTMDHPLGRLHSDIDKLFENFFQGFPSSAFSQKGKSAWEGVILPQIRRNNIIGSNGPMGRSNGCFPFRLMRMKVKSKQSLKMAS